MMTSETPWRDAKAKAYEKEAYEQAKAFVMNFMKDPLRHREALEITKALDDILKIKNVENGVMLIALGYTLSLNISASSKLSKETKIRQAHLCLDIMKALVEFQINTT